MATLQQLKDALATVADGVNKLEDAIKAMKTQAGPVSQADLDELLRAVQAIGTDLNDSSDQGA